LPFFTSVIVWPQLATKNHAVALSLLPPSQGDGEGDQKEKAKFTGWDENSLTHWQREKKITIVLIKKHMYNVQCTYDPVLIMLLISKFPSFSQLPT